MRRQLRAVVPLGLCLAALLAGCRHPAAVTPNLEFTRYRVNLDDKHAVARVVGEIVNRGAQTVPEIEVYAVLIGPGGSERGQNMVPLRDLAPGEARSFALDVTTHGSSPQVQLRYQLPQKK
jgi:hypothetical protein